MIDVSENKLQGRLPRSLANCVMLEFIVLSDNQFNDVFPFWLGNLPELKLLAMRHNGFYGVIGKPKKNLCFPELRILDLSHNNFSGKFPFEFIFSGNAMRGITASYSTYMETYSNLKVSAYVQPFTYEYSNTMTNKGVDRYYEKVQEDLGVVDISSNKFEGTIPEFMWKLKGLRFLNISHNIFTGYIPSILGNLALLESLDLSQNKLCGGIPHQFTQLTFLAEFNVSHNNLTGPIPHERQFTTFDHTSYEGNPGLCGDALPKKCGINPKTPLPPTATFEENDSDFGIEVDWKFVLAGFASGLVVGVVLADTVITRRHEWIIEIVAKLIKVLRRRPIS
ncbi:putative leucine-rich repeat domain, L domain-containing protein [Rosa chinensis]|uniref:Putative leucine-rich repeat domain, L domain-containing protein n=1 Tax=Rosa chinensis TaxID=74649 RepID=A0A2P6SFE0_ROSCH|nr:putative leucine-rich repeat domain, L domain-containing protein [Rosa chinensis]